MKKVKQVKVAKLDKEMEALECVRHSRQTAEKRIERILLRYGERIIKSINKPAPFRTKRNEHLELKTATEAAI